MIHAKWAIYSLTELLLDRKGIGGLSDHNWVELPVNAKINEGITSSDYN